MNRNVTEQLFYHINTAPAYSSHGLMEVKSTYIFSKENFNPFFNYYEVMPDPMAISGLESLRLSSIQLGSFEDFQRRAFDVANYYRLLARELLLEKVRYESFPSAPARRNCIFLFDSKDEIEKWKNTVGATQERWQVLEVRATGNILKVDSMNLPQGNEPFSVWETKAYKYWNCETTNKPWTEILLEGQVLVERILEKSF